MIASAIILAAGEGRRMGGSKARLLAFGRTLLEHHVSRLHEAGCPSIIVVVRPEDASELVARMRATFVPAVTSSQAESLAAGLRALDEVVQREMDPLLITPVDMMPAALTTLRSLVHALAPGALAVTPTHGGRGGHPVIARRELLAELGDPARPLRVVLHRAGTRRVRVEVDDPSVLGDFDTPAEWGRPPLFG